MIGFEGCLIDPLIDPKTPVLSLPWREARRNRAIIRGSGSLRLKNATQIKRLSRKRGAQQEAHRLQTFERNEALRIAAGQRKNDGK